MICWSNYITAQDLRNMDRLFFISDSDLNELKILLERRLSEWIQAWTFSPSLAVSVERRCQCSSEMEGYEFSNISHQGFGLVQVDAVKFDWATLVLGEHTGLCPTDFVRSELLASARKAFWLDVFGMSLSKATGALLEGSSFCDSICISLFDNKIGELRICLSGRRLAFLLPQRTLSFKTDGLQTRLEAISDLDIEVTLSFDFGGISFFDIVDLKKGKILKSQGIIDNNFHIIVNNKKVLKAILGRTGPMKSTILQGEI